MKWSIRPDACGWEAVSPLVQKCPHYSNEAIPFSNSRPSTLINRCKIEVNSEKTQLIEQRTNTILSVNELKLRKIYSVCLIVNGVEGLDAMKVYRRRKTNIISQQRQGHENAPKLRLDRLNNSLALHMFSVNRLFFRSNLVLEGYSISV